MVDTFTSPRLPADDDRDASDALSRRQLIRRKLRESRAAMTAADRQCATCTLNDRLVDYLFDDRTGDRIVEHGADDSRLHDLARPTTSVAGYLAIGSELDISPALATCRQRGRVTLLPVLDGDRLVFLPFDEHTVMAPNRFGIGEPVQGQSPVVNALDIDIVLVPLVGFDRRCERMGMGGGFYDRSFAARRRHGPSPWLIGVAFDCQCVEDVLPDWWDVPLDAVVTESTVHRRPA